MSDDLDPGRWLSAAERLLLGPLVRRLVSSANPRVQRALQETGAEATLRMACVNALRIYAIVLFAAGVLCRIAGVAAAAYPLYALAIACMAWSFWALALTVRPEREFRRRASGPTRSA